YSFLLDQNIRNSEALEGLAICLFHLGETASSRKCFKALAEHHGNPVGWLGMGRCFAKDGDAKQALECLQQIPEVEKLSVEDRFEFYRCQGTSQVKLGECSLGESAYLEALALHPKNDSVLVNLGSLYFQRKAF